MKLEEFKELGSLAVIGVAGVPDRNGKVYTEAALKEAAENDDRLVYKDGRLFARIPGNMDAYLVYRDLRD